MPNQQWNPNTRQMSETITLAAHQKRVDELLAENDRLAQRKQKLQAENQRLREALQNLHSRIVTARKISGSPYWGTVNWAERQHLIESILERSAE